MRRTLAAVAAASLLSLAACSGGGGDSDGASSDSGGASLAEPAPAADEDAALRDSATGSDARGAADAPAEGVAETSVISTGDVALRSDDVAQAVFDVGQVVDRLRGEIEQKNTETDDSGEVLRSRMVLRVPADTFGAAMEALEGTADLVSSNADSTDVTTQVLDVGVRVEVQRRSIERISLLLDRAESIRDIVDIEAQLSRRQADLASLEKQQDVLADQTAMSAITVSVERTPQGAAVEEDDDEAGFLSGLDAGWDALSAFGVGLATFLGAVLPWTPVLVLLGAGGWVLRRRRGATTP